MPRILTLAVALMFGASSFALAAPATDPGTGYDKDSPVDGNNGKGNDPGKSGKAPGHGLFDDSAPVWLEGLVVAGDNVAPGSGNWGGGPGNSGPGDKNGQNDKSKDGGQTPNDDK